MVSTLEIQILECSFYDNSCNAIGFIKVLTNYLNTLSEEERNECKKYFKVGRFTISDLYTLEPTKEGARNHKGLKLIFSLVIDPKKDTVIDKAGWQSGIIKLILNTLDSNRMSILGDPLVIITDETGDQIRYK